MTNTYSLPVREGALNLYSHSTEVMAIFSSFNFKEIFQVAFFPVNYYVMLELIPFFSIYSGHGHPIRKVILLSSLRAEKKLQHSGLAENSTQACTILQICSNSRHPSSN